MPRYIRLSEDGLILERRAAAVAPEGFILAPAADVVPDRAIETWWWSGSAWAPRPRLDLALVPVAGAPWSFSFVDAPPGTEIDVIELAGGDELGTAAGEPPVVTLPDAGDYLLEIRPPAPWMPAQLRVRSEGAA